jgi:urease accessory protein
MGAVRLEVLRAGEATVLLDLAQSGCLRACFPRPHGGALEAVVLNTAGGVADGDRLRIEAVAGAGTEMVLTTPAAERIYRARILAGAATIALDLRVAEGARLEFLPQETILFDGSALRRTTNIQMQASASFLGVEALLLGRAAHGETLRTLYLRDTIQLRRAGKLVLHDAIRLEGDVGAVLASAVSAGGMRAVATIVYAAPDAPGLLEALRGALAVGTARGAASSWDGIVVARLLAADARALREGVSGALAVLRHNRPLPQVWGS